MKIATSNQDLLKNINSLPGVSVVIEEAALSDALPDCRTAPEQIISVLSFLHRQKVAAQEAFDRLSDNSCSMHAMFCRMEIDGLTVLMDTIRDGLNAWGQSQADGVAFFGVYWVNDAGNHVLCEVDGGTCYDAHRDFNKALQSAGIANQMFKTDRYIVKAIPAGVKVFDSETECAIITSESITVPVKNSLPGVEFYRHVESSLLYIVVNRAAYWFDSVNGCYRAAGNCINVGDMRRNVSGAWSKL